MAAKDKETFEDIVRTHRDSTSPSTINAFPGLTTGEMVGLYFGIIGASTLFRYLLLPCLIRSPQNEGYLTITSLQLSAVLAILLLAINRSRLFSVFSLRVSPKDALLAITVGLVGANLSRFVASLSETIYIRHPLSLPVFILVDLIAPVVEEVLFRGIFFESVSRKFPLPVSILICSVVFASFHVSFWSGLVGGILLTYLYVASRHSLGSAILAHMIANIASNAMGGLLLYKYYLPIKSI